MSGLSNRSNEFLNELAEEFTRDHDDQEDSRHSPSLATPRQSEIAQAAREPFAPLDSYPVAASGSIPKLDDAPFLSVRQAD
jgi:hypothetical protein